VLLDECVTRRLKLRKLPIQSAQHLTIQDWVLQGSDALDATRDGVAVTNVHCPRCARGDDITRLQGHDLAAVKAFMVCSLA
jgi:hypothetical protein